jgi:hypothetical protein
MDIILSEFGNAKLVPHNCTFSNGSYLSDSTDIMLGMFPPSVDFNGYLPPEFYDSVYLGDVTYDFGSIDIWIAGMLMLRLLSVRNNAFPATEENFLFSHLSQVLHAPNVYDILEYFYGQFLGPDVIHLLVCLLRRAHLLQIESKYINCGIIDFSIPARKTLILRDNLNYNLP